MNVQRLARFKSLQCFERQERENVPENVPERSSGRDSGSKKI